MSSTSADEILSYLAGQKHEMIALLERLVRAESPSLEPESQRAVQSILTAELEQLDFEVRRVGGRGTGPHLYARPRRRRRQAPIQLLLGHCDTVWPLGTLDEMPVEISAETMAGPGVYDMKAGLMLLIFALRALRHLGRETTLTPVVLMNSDEEIGSPDSTRHIRRLAQRAQRALILEPPLGLSGKLKTTRKGSGKFVVHIAGKAAHAGLNPQDGASAIRELAHIIEEVYALERPDAGITLNVGVVSGGLRVNVVAPEARAEVDLRALTLKDARRVEKAILGLQPATQGVTVEIQGGLDKPPLEPTPRNRALWQLAVQLGQELGMELEESLAGGVSDGNTASLYTATLDGLGAVGEGAHATNESIRTSSLAERGALLALLLLAPPVDASQTTA